MAGKITFTRPLSPGPLQNSARSSPIPKDSNQGPAPTVLLVEDEAAIRQMLWHLLLAEGYTVLEAGDGREALELARTHPGPIHLVITDIVMPRMSGIELTAHIAAERPETKVLLMSGHCAEESIPPGTELLIKPFAMAHFRRKVRGLLQLPER